MTANPLIGTWKLISCEFRCEDGQTLYHWGKDAVGYLIHTEDGFMSVHIMNANRPKLTSGDFISANPEEKLGAAETYVSYCGRYQIQKNQIIHEPKASSFPNLVGVTHKATFELNGNTLTLNWPPSEWGGIRGNSYVVWERI